MLEKIWDGIKSVFVGGVKIVVGVAKAAWTVIKFAVKAVVWVVAGIFTIAGHLAGYVGKTLSSLFKPKDVVVIPPQKIPALVDFLEKEAEVNGIIDDPDVMVVHKGLKEAAENNQSMIFAEGTDENGEVAVSDPEFVSASSYEGKIQEAIDNNQIYRKKIRVAG